MQTRMRDLNRRVVILGAAASIAVLSTMSFLADGSFGDSISDDPAIDPHDVRLTYGDVPGSFAAAREGGTLAGTLTTGGRITVPGEGSRTRDGGAGGGRGSAPTDPTGEAPEGSGPSDDDAVDGVADDVGEAVGGITDTVDDTVDDATDTVGGGTDTVDGVVDGATDTVDDTIDDATDTVDDATDTVDDVTDAVEGTVDDATDAVEDTVDDVTDVLP